VYNIQYLHITIIYVLLISYISHTPASSLPESGSNFSDLDKLFHFLEFFLLGFLIQQSLVERQIKPKGNLLFITLILGFSIACIDELHQSMVNGRNSSVQDLVFDFAGIISSLFFFKNYY
jgi:VanZ family protein